MTAAILGSALSVAGIVILSNSVNSTYNNNGKVGSSLFLLGIPLGVTGSILWPIGARKLNQYTKKLKNMSLNFNYSPNQQGFALTYQF